MDYISIEHLYVALDYRLRFRYIKHLIITLAWALQNACAKVGPAVHEEVACEEERTELEWADKARRPQRRFGTGRGGRKAGRWSGKSWDAAKFQERFSSVFESMSPIRWLPGVSGVGLR